MSFQGRGTLLGQEITDTGTYWQTVRPGGVLYGEGHALFMTSVGDVVDWVGGGVGRSTGPGYKASYGVWSSARTGSEKLARLGEVADVLEYEVEEDGSYRWTMWEWTGVGLRADDSASDELSGVVRAGAPGERPAPAAFTRASPVRQTGPGHSVGHISSSSSRAPVIPYRNPAINTRPSAPQR